MHKRQEIWDLPSQGLALPSDAPGAASGFSGQMCPQPSCPCPPVLSSPTARRTSGGDTEIPKNPEEKRIACTYSQRVCGRTGWTTANQTSTASSGVGVGAGDLQDRLQGTCPQDIRKMREPLTRANHTGHSPFQPFRSSSDPPEDHRSWVLSFFPFYR